MSCGASRAARPSRWMSTAAGCARWARPTRPFPGHNLVLTLDLELQRAATAALQEALDKSSGFTKATQGVAIAMDPRNGKILAMVSLPGFDNNLFAKGVTTEAWEALVSNPDHPMFDQAVGGQYPPGSIFKPIVASAALQEGVINSQTLLGDGFDGANDGIIWLPNRYLPGDRTKDQKFVSWNAKQGFGWGKINVKKALAVSDDIFFYQLGGGYLDIFRGWGLGAGLLYQPVRAGRHHRHRAAGGRHRAGARRKVEAPQLRRAVAHR